MRAKCLLLNYNFFFIRRSIGFYAICVKVSQRVHNAMVNGLISTSMRFFDTNPLGTL